MQTIRVLSSTGFGHYIDQDHPNGYCGNLTPGKTYLISNTRHDCYGCLNSKAYQKWHLGEALISTTCEHCGWQQGTRPHTHHTTGDTI